MAHNIEIKESIEFKLEDFNVLYSLPHTNYELTALLYDCSEKRNEVIYALRHPKDFLNHLERILNISYKMHKGIKKFANSQKIKLPDTPNAEIMNISDANIYVFHHFSCEEINMIHQCYFISKGLNNTKVLNLESNIRHSINILVTIQLDLTVTIIRFEEYLRRFPSADLRREHIQQNFINNSYE